MASKLRILELELEVLKEQENTLNGIFKIQDKNEIKLQRLAVERKIAEENYNTAKKVGSKLTEDEIKEKFKEVQLSEKKIDNEKESIKNNNAILQILTKSYWYQAAILKVLNDNDKIIRQTTLNLGLSGNKALNMRSSFESIASSVFMLGGGLEDVLKIQTGFADETGRAQVLTSDMVKDVILISKGTAMGVEQATKLASQFQIMGLDTKRTMEYVQGVVDSSERMGINTTKVLNNIANNFKKLQTMSFTSGVAGYAKMAEYAEQMKMDMAESIQSSKMANNLEKSIDLAAQLQVMGGEFAKTDPFQLLYLSRNAPDEFAKRMNEMTKGLVTFRKMADGTFQKFISPADRDRLEAVSKATGISLENLTEQALRMADFDRIKQTLLGTGFSKKDKELITGQATFDTKLGKFLIQIGETRKDITALTSEDIKALEVQKTSLEQRAKDAMTFNETLDAMVNALKSTLLPLMRGIKTVLEPLAKVVTGITDFANNINKGFMSGIGAVLGGILVAQALVKISVGLVNSIKSTFALMRGSSISSGAAGATGIGGYTRAGRIGRSSGSTISNPNAGKGLMRGGLGIGAAAVGIGAGIGIAAVGIGQLADSIKDVDLEKIKQLNWTVGIIGVTMIGMGAAAIFATGPVAAFGLAALGIGAGIGVAAAGVGYMADGLSKLVESSKGADIGLVKVAAGVAALNLAMGATGFMGAIGSFLGGSALEKTLNTIGKNADKISVVGNAFKEINTILSANKDDFTAIEGAINAISNMNTSKGSAFAQLADLLNKPLKVEFSDNKVALVSNITLEIDGEKLMQKAYRADVRVQRDVDVKINKLGK